MKEQKEYMIYHSSRMLEQHLDINFVVMVLNRFEAFGLGRLSVIDYCEVPFHPGPLIDWLTCNAFPILV